MKQRVTEILLNKRGQTAAEYVITAASIFLAIMAFYVAYSRLVPQQFETGAKYILTVYEAN